MKVMGEYVGGGQGDLEPECTEDPDDDDAEITGDASDADDGDEIAEDSSEQAHPLLLIYDCEVSASLMTTSPRSQLRLLGCLCPH